MNELERDYQKVVKLWGLFGVSQNMISTVIETIVIYAQRRGLYVFDPLALHHILIQDTSTFRVPEWSLEYVF